MMRTANRDRPARAALATAVALLAALFALSAWTLEAPATAASRAEVLRGHARYLASEELTGRGVDTPGIALARDYIAAEFARYGLQPGGDNGTYLQGFEVTTGVKVKQPAVLAFDDQPELKLDRDWVPLGFSASDTIAGEVVFAGYGITAKDHGYDDYDGLDVKGKIVIVLRYEPPPSSETSPFRKHPSYSAHSTLRAKAANARDHGAAGMILVDLHDSEDKGLMSTGASLWLGARPLLAVQARRGAVEKWLQSHGVSLAELRAKIDAREKPSSMPVPGAKAKLRVSLEEARERTENVIGVLPGADPRLRHESVVLGAHYDHIGLGNYGTRDSSSRGQIHFGADDNASGVAVLLDAAQRLGASAASPARTVIFVAFSGEELGLYGSRHYVNNPPLPLSATRVMLNLDMVGRLRDDRLTVFGTRSAAELGGIVKRAAGELGLEIRESDNVGRSDHMSFYSKRVPSLHFFTGIHPEYHRPGDTWDKLNIDGMLKVGDLVLATIRRLAETQAPLSFVELPTPSSSPGQAAPPVYLGSIPDYSARDQGVLLAGVSQGSPAALAGLRQGDVIIQLAETRIHGLEDLMFALNGKNPGDEVEIIVLRAKQPVSLKAVLRARG